MIINANIIYSGKREQLFQAARNEKIGAGTEASFLKPFGLISANGVKGNQAVYRLRNCMEEIKDLQLQLSKLQEDENFIERMQKELLQVEENIASFLANNNLEDLLTNSRQNDSGTILVLKKLQENIKKSISEKLVAQENISASLAAVREKSYADKIMLNLKNIIGAERSSLISSGTQLQRGSIRSLLG